MQLTELWMALTLHGLRVCIPLGYDENVFLPQGTVNVLILNPISRRVVHIPIALLSFTHTQPLCIKLFTKMHFVDAHSSLLNYTLHNHS